MPDACIDVVTFCDMASEVANDVGGTLLADIDEESSSIDYDLDVDCAVADIDAGSGVEEGSDIDYDAVACVDDGVVSEFGGERGQVTNYGAGQIVLARGGHH